MALKIERNGIDFLITTPGDRLAKVHVYATSIEEVVHAINHYFDAQHLGVPKTECPICRQVLAEAKPGRRRGTLDVRHAINGVQSTRTINNV